MATQTTEQPTAQQDQSIVEAFSTAESAKDLREYATSVLMGSITGATTSTNSSKSTTDSEFVNEENFMGVGELYPKFIKIESNESPYISLGHLYTLINVLFLYSDNRSEFIENINKLKKSRNGLYKKEDFLKKNKPYIDLGLYAIFKNHKLLRSFAPKKVLIFNSDAECMWVLFKDPSARPSVSDATPGTSNFNPPAQVAPDPYSGVSTLYSEVKSIYVNTDAYIEAPSGWKELSKDYVYGSISRIFINIDVVIKFLETSDLYSFIDSINDTINTSVSDYIKLIRDADDFEPRAIKILDSSILAARKDYIFNVYDKNTNIKNISLQSKLPKEFQSVAYVANTSANPMQRDANLKDAFAAISGEYVDRGGSDNNYNPNSKRGYADPINDKELNTAVEAVLSRKLDDLTASGYEKLFMHVLKHHQVDVKIALGAVAGGTGVVRTFVISPDTRSKDEVIGFPLNVQLSFDIDGIGGIYYGNVFGISYGPSFIVKNVLFQATNIEHEISIDSGWVTKINGIIRALQT